ncbi:hypothetical protein BAE44_0023197 [Dichanthelium oligosanthes]|uniref:Prolamin-like domain-containing protein n=1 Tax=Dichanthelium oligosanthes TaxID=888268 RepID=A0A1E5USI0_9POAL|nr:hypothetical protein BAE44_0023197 [Dichanthelium oligosanthes]
MASSNKCTLIVLLVAFAVVAPSLLHPSAAARDGGAAKAAAAPAPSASGEVLHPTGWFDGFDPPLLRILPCPPAFPIKIPFIPCYNVTPPVTECRPSLEKFMPACAGFLTDGSSVSSPRNKLSAATPSLRSSMIQI